jgi:hypothetical protein
MKIMVVVLSAVALAIVLIVAGAWLGSTFAQNWGQDAYGLAQYGPMGGMMGGGWDSMLRDQGRSRYDARGYGMMGQGTWGRDWDEMPCSDTEPGYNLGGYGMMGPGAWGPGWDGMPCSGADAAPGGGTTLPLEDAQAAVERYAQNLEYTGLHLTEVMEFERNFYAILAEEDTGIGAMELLVSKAGGAVGPEPGPNMMWNAKYGMHRGGRMGMMGTYAEGEMTVPAAEAEEIAQRWLDDNLPGRSAGEADPFYGYYTLHFLKDGQIEGMLSVHGSTGDVWYHSWHGGFIDMTGDHD